MLLTIYILISTNFFNHPEIRRKALSQPKWQQAFSHSMRTEIVGFRFEYMDGLVIDNEG